MNRTFCLAAALCVAGGAAQAETYAGVAVLSDYVASGMTQSDGQPVVQAYVDHQLPSGFYAAVWASTVKLGDSRVELDLYAGYRGEVGKLRYDVGYYRYFYDHLGDCCGDVITRLKYAATEELTLGAKIKTNLHGSLYIMPQVAYSLPHGFGVNAEWEYDDNSPEKYWGIGASKSFDNGVTASLSYYDRTDVDPTLVFSLAFNTRLFN